MRYLLILDFLEKLHNVIQRWILQNTNLIKIY